MSRRRFLALVGVMGAVAAAGSACARADAAGSVLHTRWDRHPDGPMPTAGDEGVPITITSATTTTAPTITRGALQAHLPRAQSALYVNQQLPSRLRRIGAVFGLVPGATSGTLALVAWVGGPHLAAHCHAAFTGDRWILGVVDDDRLTEIAGNDYASPLPRDGGRCRVEVVFDGADAAITLPDGSVERVHDDRFLRESGTIACWEFYKNDGAEGDVALYESWAS